MRSSEELRRVINSETGDLLAYRTGPQAANLVRLCDALIDDALLELATIAPERLLFKQGALAQLRALRDLIVTGNPHQSAKV